ncbi:MAG: LysR family transcriptional regulator [Deltaproteobacteria bacterium]|nr:LysR family transcriptional regulator [Deltaproteobacteria bacterium]
MSATIDDVSLFVHVLRAGSLTAAAAERGVPKSTVSRALTRLETELGAQLVRRSPRALKLTDLGQRFFDEVTPHVDALSQATQLVHQRVGRVEGTLRLSAAPDMAESVANLVSRFCARYPKIRVEVDLSTRLVDFATDRVDVALRATDKVRDGSVVARKIASTKTGLYAAPSYLARKPAPRSFAELSEHDHVSFRPSAKTPMMLVDEQDNEYEFLSQGRIGGDQFVFIRAALRNGAGVGPLPEFFAREDVQEGRLVRVLPGLCVRSGNLFLVYPAAKHVPRAVAALRDMVLEQPLL